ncbi:hypothetical protein DFJ74DRAFT_657354, partial [Hyaloraphidium curvatum]
MVRGRPVRVVASARSPEKAAKLATEARVLDFDEPKGFQAALEGIDAIFIATGYTSDMLSQTVLLSDAAVAAGVTHVVHLGADRTGALGRYKHVVWHRLVEEHLEHAFGPSGGRTCTLLHPGFFTSNLQTYAGFPFFDPRSGTVTSLFPPYGVSPWIDSEDIGEVAARCLLDPDRHGGKTYRLAAEPLAIDEVCGILSKVAGRPIGYELVDPDGFLARCKEDTPNDFGKLAYMACIADMIRTTQAAMARASSSGTTRGRPPAVWPEVIREICGREPTSVEDFARREAYRFRLPDSGDGGAKARM